MSTILVAEVKLYLPPVLVDVVKEYLPLFTAREMLDHIHQNVLKRWPSLLRHVRKELHSAILRLDTEMHISLPSIYPHASNGELEMMASTLRWALTPLGYDVLVARHRGYLSIVTISCSNLVGPSSAAAFSVDGLIADEE